jgi:transcriptional/translational regulatory protein YebC/TACO1
VLCDKTKLIQVKNAIEAKGFAPKSTELVFLPSQRVETLDEEQLQAFKQLLEAFDNNEDVQQVVHNYSGALD